MAGVKYEDGFVKFAYYNRGGFPDPPPADPSITKFLLDINISVPAPPPWTLASKLSEQKRILFTSNAQSMLDHYNKIKDTNFEFVRLVRVQTYLGRGDNHHIQFEAKPSGAADHTLKTFEAAIYERFYPTREVFPVACGLVVSNYQRNELVKYEDGFVKFAYYNRGGFPDPPPADPSITKFLPNINISVPAPPPWTLASKLSEQKRILFTSNAQSMLDHYNKIKDTNFEFVRLVRVQTYLGRGDNHHIQFEAKPSGAADHTLKTFEAEIYERFYPTREVFPVACGLVVSNYQRNE